MRVFLRNQNYSNGTLSVLSFFLSFFFLFIAFLFVFYFPCSISDTSQPTKAVRRGRGCIQEKRRETWLRADPLF